ncbi:dsDNA nuclease domain-containing protein [Candidatus Nitrosocosmicus hydrocola]|uniref:dsDNA nuclease domain-containing protein n=1 Tax=Candidatus Nitrosocosmicus hydrocola TaxID=1826872 RepID=UPI0011E5C52C|nr:dsDNA nuclease domain-containing protein [Candidatus Nitrosocosmicus hydrocola]
MVDNKEVAQSEKGGKSALDGFKYEKDIIAFLSARMYCDTERITKIICEYKNDIEIEMEEIGLCSWQVKKTDAPKLPKNEIIESIKLFHHINKTGNYSRFILTSNKDLANTNLPRVDLRQISYLREKFPRFGNMLRELSYDPIFMSKLYFIKGPDTDSIRSIIKDEMKCISDKDNFLDQLNTLIDKIWNGITYISDRKIIEYSKTDNPTKEFKTIDKERLNKFESSIDLLPKPEIMFVDDSTNVPKIQILDLDKSKAEELFDDFQFNEYKSDVLKELSSLSSTHYVYKHNKIISILEGVMTSNDKHELQQFFYILINMFRISKEYDKVDYERLIQRFDEYIESSFISTQDKFRYPYLTIKDIVNENFVDKLCRLNLERIKNYLYDLKIKDEHIISICNNNIEYLKRGCEYEKAWKDIVMACDRDISFRQQMYRIIKYG